MVSFGSQIDFSVPHIQIRHLNKFYDVQDKQVHALKNINLDIPQGKILGIIGKSGAGKSSLLRTLNGLEQANEGNIHIHQQEIATLSHQDLIQLRQKIGMIFQHFNLMQTKTVAANIEMPMKLLGWSKAEREKRLEELLDFIDLKHKRHAFPDELSGGQKQRVGIARALANHPKILLCDEATSALDPQTTKSVLQLLKKINEEQGITIVMVTHEMDVIETVCDYVAVMEKGDVIETGSTLQIFSQPQHPTTKNFIQTVLQQHLPVNILNNLENQNHNSIYCLKFLGSSAQETVIQAVIKQFDISLNILFANMTEINGTVIGQMFIQLLGDAQEIQAAIKFLEQHGVQVDQAGVQA